MRLLYFIVLISANVHCGNEIEKDNNADPTRWSNEVTVPKDSMQPDDDSNLSVQADNDSSLEKGVIFSSENEERHSHEDFMQEENQDKDIDTNNQIRNTTVTENVIKEDNDDFNASSSEGTDMLHFLERLFEKVEFPMNQDIPMLNRKVFRGARVSIREHPYIVSIRREFSHYLTGTLLTHQVVITVAHPVYRVPLNELRAVVGENYNDRGTKLLTIVLLIIHESFNPSTLRGDLALLMIYEDINYKFTVKPIPIYPPDQSLEGTTAFVTGWGRCDRSGKELCLPRSSRYFRNEIIDPMLRTIKFIINDTSCSTDYYEKRLKYGIICPGDARSEDLLCPCMAVPGAPLVVDASLAGLTSWGFGCGYVDDRPLVYTSTAAYQPWLIHNIPILRNVAKEQLTPLFQATKANFIMNWLRHTRIIFPKLQRPPSEMNPIEVDLELAKLRGHVYDIRDFIYDKKFRTAKKALFMNIKSKMKGSNQGHVKKLLLITDILRVNPFMGEEVLNGTGLSLSNGSLVQNEESSEDSSDDLTEDTTDSHMGTEDTAYFSFYKRQTKPVIHF